MENLATFNEKHALPLARNIQDGINNIITVGLLEAFKAYCENDNKKVSEWHIPHSKQLKPLALPLV